MRKEILSRKQYFLQENKEWALVQGSLEVTRRKTGSMVYDEDKVHGYAQEMHTGKSHLQK